MNHKTIQIGIIGIACRFPDADNPKQLWENILAQRRAFRKMPKERLSPDYFSKDLLDKDKVYTDKAAVLTNFQFDRIKFKISGKNFRTADLAHWLALQVAAEALEDANILDSIPKINTGVFLGNTLTGEISRSNSLRLRWPYVAKIVAEQLKKSGKNKEEINQFLGEMEISFKSSFPELEEDSLAGGLSNTIAGRICNYFDFKGGGYTVDGACSSSLLAISNACSAIREGNLELALAGGVDISLDPFELVGFSRTAALAKREMLVYDSQSQGFLPGEGCGFVLLAGDKFIEKHQLPVYAWVRGWGISSDGQGGLTRPNSDGQALAMKRAYRKTDFDISEIDYLEGHGTGTKVGDHTELEAICKAINQSKKTNHSPISIGSIKANIGHTKAAAGIAGLIKATLVVHIGLIPPTSGNKKPHPLFNQTSQIQLPREAIRLQDNKPIRAGVSAMGFGGINTHVAIEGGKKLYSSEKIRHNHQDAELFLFATTTKEKLIQAVERISLYAARLSLAELSDLSNSLFLQLEQKKYKLAIVANDAEQLKVKLEEVLKMLRKGVFYAIKKSKGIFLGNRSSKPRIGYLFPGQGGNLFDKKSLTALRFPKQTIPFLQKLDAFPNNHITKIQPTLLTASRIALDFLEVMGIQAKTTIGHSLGELFACYWSKAISWETLLLLASERERLMDSLITEKGGMLSISAPAERVKNLLSPGLCISAYNSPRQTVVSGTLAAIDNFKSLMKQQKIPCIALQVNHPFHSPLMAPISLAYNDFLETLNLEEPQQSFYSTVSNKLVDSKNQLKSDLLGQLEQPVRFQKAVELADKEVDLWLELGAGQTLEKMTESISSKTVISLNLPSNTMEGLLKTTALLFSEGAAPQMEFLFSNRFFRPFELDWKPKFISNPCEMFIGDGLKGIDIGGRQQTKPTNIVPLIQKEQGVQRQFIKTLAFQLELPVASISANTRMLDDLHLNSLKVGQIIAEFATQLEIPITKAPTEYANASVAEIIDMLENHKTHKEEELYVEGLKTWVRQFEIVKKEVLLKPALHEAIQTQWHVIGEQAIVRKTIQKTNPATANGIFTSLLKMGEEKTIEALMDSLSFINKNKHVKSWVILQDRPKASGFAKSFYLDNPDFDVLVLNIENELDCTNFLLEELADFRGFSEVFYNQKWRRALPFIIPVENSQKSTLPLGGQDCVLVTGGGKGITAECAYSLAKATGVKLILLGRSKPENDEKLARNLARFQAARLDFHYFSIDVSDRAALSSGLAQIQKNWGTITALIHGAGLNQPSNTNLLTKEKIITTLTPKLFGLRNLLSCLDKDKLRLLTSFGSIIAKSGMNGNADYALANEWLSSEIKHFSIQHPNCRCLNMEWSVWGGTGMGAHLGVLDQLLRKGIQPIPLDKGVDVFLKLLGSQQNNTDVILSSRLGDLKTLQFPKEDLPMLRFLETIKVHYPNTELVADFLLSETTDLYLKDHKIDGQFVFPAVMGMEAMMQGLYALSGYKGPVAFEEVDFLHPILVPNHAELCVRLLALRLEDGSFSFSLRTAATGFKQDHFRARLVPQDQPIDRRPSDFKLQQPNLNIKQDFYGNLVFHKGIFCRLSKYLHLSPYEALVEAKSLKDIAWFSTFLSPTLLSTDPALRDAALHAVQACVPAYFLLPVSVERVFLPVSSFPETVFIHANEIERQGDSFFYDIWICNKKGEILELWERAEFRIFRKNKPNKGFPLSMVRLTLQRGIDEQADSRRSLQIAFSPTDFGKVLKRADGKPFLQTEVSYSKAHCGSITMQVAASKNSACDLELVHSKNGQWSTLLGKENMALAKRLFSADKSSFSTSATQVWSVLESVRKAGLPFMSPIKLEKSEANGIHLLHVEDCAVITYCCQLLGIKEEMVFCILLNINKR